jgi:hypothetical protein
MPAGWVFSGVRVTSAQSLDMKGLLFFGDLINNTGAAQNLTYINSTYYDAGGQKIPYGATIDNVPLRTIPHGGRVPFELIAEDLNNVADFDLQAVAEPGQNAPRQDFEFLDVTTTSEGSNFCVAGRLRNPNAPLSAYLMIVAVLYDGQNQVINYGYVNPASPIDVIGDNTLDVNLCADRQNQEVARYELRAWGQ